MKLGFKAIEARWNDDTAKWTVKLQDVKSGNIFSDRCDVLITAIGNLNEWRWPKIPGLHDFEGQIIHSAAWDPKYDYKVCSKD